MSMPYEFSVSVPAKPKPFKNARRFAIELHQLGIVIATQSETLKSRRRRLAQELQHCARIRSAIDIIAEQENEFRSLNALGIRFDAAMRIDELAITSVDVAHRIDRGEIALGKCQPSALLMAASQYRYLLSPRDEIVEHVTHL